MPAKNTTPPPTCILAAGLSSALFQAAGFVSAVLLLRANLMWGNGRDLHVGLSSLVLSFLAVLVPALLLKIRYRMSGAETGVIALMSLSASPAILVMSATAVGVVTTGAFSLEPGLYAMLASAFMILPGLPGAGLGAWAGSHWFQTRKDLGASA